MIRFLKKRYQRPGFFAGVFLMLGLSVHAQVYYSTRPDYLKSKTESNNILAPFRNDYPDTTIDHLSNFFPLNVAGNPGLPSPALRLSYGSDDLGFRIFEPPTANDRFLEKNIAYFKSRGPYAWLNGIAGSKQLQAFRMLFTHTYREKVNITIRFNRYTSKGFYSRQQTYTNNLFVTSNYTTLNRRFGYYLFVLNNGNKNDESGGIADGRITDSTLLLNKELLDPRITAASRDNRETKLMLNPWVRVNKRKDSLHRNDHYLQLKSKVSFNSYRYKDVNMSTDGFYDHAFLDSITLDSTNHRKFSNELAYSIVTRSNRFAISAGYRNELNNVWQGAKKVYTNNMAVAGVVFRQPRLFSDSTGNRSAEAAFDFQYVLDGYNKNDMKVEGRSYVNINHSKRRILFLDALYETRRADRIYEYWYSNHFIWENKFAQQKQLQLNTGLKMGRNFSLGLLYQSIGNYLYFDENALPVQSGASISNISASVFLQKVFFKHLGVSVNYVYQLTSNTNLIRLPADITTGRLFYQGNLFRNNLQLQLGVQVQEYAPFKSYAYMPSTQLFYLQDAYTTVRYPYTDVFLNARIRPVSFFLKVENALHGLAGTGHSFIPGYYQSDRAFRMGISWVFFD